MTGIADVVDLVTRYAWAMDDKDVAAVLECFWEDATFELVTADGAVIGPRHGRDEMRAHFNGTIGTQTDIRRHVITNVRILRIDGDDVHAGGYLTLMVTVDGRLEARCTGRYRWTVRTREGRARLAGSSLTLDGAF